MRPRVESWSSLVDSFSVSPRWLERRLTDCCHGSYRFALLWNVDGIICEERMEQYNHGIFWRLIDRWWKGLPPLWSNVWIPRRYIHPCSESPRRLVPTVFHYLFAFEQLYSPSLNPKSPRPHISKDIRTLPFEMNGIQKVAWLSS